MSPHITTCTCFTSNWATPSGPTSTDGFTRRYKPDDNAADRAVRLAREKYPAANHAAEAVVIYPLQRPGAPRLDGDGTATKIDDQ